MRKQDITTLKNLIVAMGICLMVAYLIITEPEKGKGEENG